MHSQFGMRHRTQRNFNTDDLESYIGVENLQIGYFFSSWWFDDCFQEKCLLRLSTYLVLFGFVAVSCICLAGSLFCRFSCASVFVRGFVCVCVRTPLVSDMPVSCMCSIWGRHFDFFPSDQKNPKSDFLFVSISVLCPSSILSRSWHNCCICSMHTEQAQDRTGTGTFRCGRRCSLRNAMPYNIGG